MGSVGIATRYGLDGPGIESRWGRDFSRLSSLLYNGYRVFPGGKAAEAWCWPPSPSKCRGHERVGLYLYSPSGPQWPVIGRTFTFTLAYYSLVTNSSLLQLTGLHNINQDVKSVALIIVTWQWSIINSRNVKGKLKKNKWKEKLRRESKWGIASMRIIRLPPRCKSSETLRTADW